MAEPIRFTVYGRPQQRGSKTPWNPRRADGSLVLRGDGRPVIATMDSNKKSKDWMQQVRAEAADVYQGELIAGSIMLGIAFYFVRPKSHFRTGRNSHLLRDNAPTDHTQTPDLSKLVRCTEDALTGIVWRDDSQVCSYDGTCKHWTTEQARAEITIVELTPSVKE